MEAPSSATTLLWDVLTMRINQVGQYARPTHGYAAIRKAAMAAFAKSWRHK
jgi:hypothetical protein